jgi:hypothetical protein
MYLPGGVECDRLPYGQGPIVSPCAKCAGSACASTVIVTNGFVAEWVWWQIVTRPAYPYPELDPEVCEDGGAELAAHTRTPAMLNTPKRVKSLRRIDPPLIGSSSAIGPYQVSSVFPRHHGRNLGKYRKFDTFGVSSVVVA